MNTRIQEIAQEIANANFLDSAEFVGVTVPSQV